MEQTADFFGRAGLTLRKVGHARGYRGEIEGLPDIDVALCLVIGDRRGAEIRQRAPWRDRRGPRARKMSDAATRVASLRRSDSVSPTWSSPRRRGGSTFRPSPISTRSRAAFRRAHGRRPRVATKYVNLTRRFFASKGFGDYRIVASYGATEGTPAAGAAELVVDITTTGETLRANGLKILDDGVILKSQANLIASNVADWSRAHAVGARCAAGAVKVGQRALRPSQQECISRRRSRNGRQVRRRPDRASPFRACGTARTLLRFRRGARRRVSAHRRP